MRAAIALVFAALLGGCLPPVNADTADLAWERCESAGLDNDRLGQCSVVIGFAGTSPERRAAALIIRGAIRTESGDYVRALADLGRAMRINADDARVYLQRGLIHQAQGSFEFALRDFDRAIALQPNLEAAYQGRENVLVQQVAAFRDELIRIDAALQRTPNDPTMLNARCWLRTVNNDDLDAALADCNASLAASPDDANVHDSRGLVYFKRGDYAASLADYETAVRLQPERGHFLFGRGIARIALGMTAEGNADLERAEELEPGIATDYSGYNITMPTAPPADAEVAPKQTPAP